MSGSRRWASGATASAAAARTMAAFAVAVTAAAPLAAQRHAFTLEQVLSDPFPSEMLAAPTGGAVAWVFDEAGARNVWVAETPDYHARRLTPYDADDGQELSGLTWTPDGRAVVYVRGGDSGANWSAGHYPNPAMVIGGVKQEIWIVSLDGGVPRRVAEGRGPAVSPRGDVIAFRLKGQIWSVPVTGGKATQLLHTPLGSAGSLTWSPDGSKLAFVSSRGDHAFIGVLDVAAKRLRYLAPSVDRDFAPVWSPDGKHIAFIRVPARATRVVFGPRRSGQPWSVWVGDPATGEAHRVWGAREGTGSVYRRVSAEHQLWWGAGERLVFPWEGDGWTHLYSVPAAGGDATPLTPGAFEVEYVALSPDGRTVFFNSNQGDIDRRHLWKVAVSGGRPTAVTQGEGIEWAPTPLSDGKTVALLRSDALRPARPAILSGGGAPRDLAADALPADFPAPEALVTPRQVIFSSADGMALHGQLFVPRGLKRGERRPAVVFFHGGSRRQMLLGWHYMEYYHNMYAMNQYLASRGYVVLAVNYRSGIGYGMEFREALHYGAAGASEFNDVQAAGLFLRNRADVDPARIGLYGGSYGGYLTAMGLARASDLFAAGVDWAGVHDWNLEVRQLRPGGWDLDAEQRARKLAWRSSPMSSVDTWRSPVLLVQGDDDRNVAFSQTVQLAERLRAQGVHVEQLVYPDEIHDFLIHRHWVEALVASAEFMDRMLGR